MIKLALVNVCLAGKTNQTEREEALEAMIKDCNYVILFKGMLGR
jgi:hypothetical protein